MSAPDPIREEDLHAYVDGELEEPVRAEVEAWLADHPDDASRVAAWQRQKAQLHSAFDHVMTEPVPADMRAAVARARVRAPWPAWARAAAGIVLFVAGAAAGWGLRGGLAPAEPAAGNFVRQAVSAHVVYVGEKRHAVEVWADEEKHLVAWLSNRLGQAIKAPHLTGAGFRLVGGRLVADAGAPAAQFMYEDKAGRRLTLYARRTRAGGDAAFQFVSQQGVSAFYWIGGKLAFALIGKMERAELLSLARAVYAGLSL